MFYLARSYEHIGQYEQAINYYLQRIEGAGWEEEVYYSYYSITCCKIKLRDSFVEIAEFAFKAFEYRPTRLESLYELIVYCRKNEMFQTGYLIGKNLLDLTPPKEDKLFIHIPIYEWMLRDEVSICVYHTGNYQESLNMCNELLKLPQVPEKHKTRIKKNAPFPINHL